MVTHLKFEILLVASLYMILSNKRMTKGADQSGRMCRLVCAFLFANPEDRVSRVEAQIKLVETDPYA